MAKQSPTTSGSKTTRFMYGPDDAVEIVDEADAIAMKERADKHKAAQSKSKTS